jgi:hypothetical protein
LNFLYRFLKKKYLNIKSHVIHPVEAELIRSGERTIMAKLVVAFRSLAEEPKQQLHRQRKETFLQNVQTGSGAIQTSYSTNTVVPSGVGRARKVRKGHGVKVATGARFFV